MELWRCPNNGYDDCKHYGSGSGAATVGKPLVHPATVDLRGKVYELLRKNATGFLMDDIYRNPGPLQFEGPGADSKAVSLYVEDLDYMGRIKELNDYLDKRNEDPNKEPPTLSQMFEHTRKRKEGNVYADTYDDTTKKIEQMRNYKPLEDDSVVVDPFHVMMSKEYDEHRRLYGVTNKLIKKNGGGTSYMVPREHMESLKAIEAKEKELVDMENKLVEEHERKKIELEEYHERKKSRVSSNAR